MSFPVVATATVMCTFGVGTSTLVSTNKIMVENKPILTVNDCSFGANVLPFPMCSAPSNPAVIAATAAAMGVPTPSTCLGTFLGPWVPERADILFGGQPCVTEKCSLNCLWGGMIKIISPGQTTTSI